MKITVITINYNNKEGLARTLESVARQSTKDFEYIVVDGGSKDGSQEEIKKYENVITKWVSEPDGGIYNAMNKGVELARGKYCLFLNSGDEFHSPDAICHVLSSGMTSDIVLTRVINYDQDGKEYPYIPPEKVTFREIYQKGIHHAGSFIKTELMRAYPYREDLRICSDRDFFIKTIIFDNVSYQSLDIVTCNFAYGGASSDMELVYKEKQAILSSYFPARFIEEYNTSNLEIMKMTSELEKGKYRLISLVCKIDLLMIKFLKALLGKRFYRDKYL